MTRNSAPGPPQKSDRDFLQGADIAGAKPGSADGAAAQQPVDAPFYYRLDRKWTRWGTG